MIMKIGYPCLNWSLPCSPNKTFRLKNYSIERLNKTIENNLSCLKSILEYNVAHNLLFFRISSDTVPFASHEVCTFDWSSHFRKPLRDIGSYIRDNSMRISMHPDQFTLINAYDDKIVDRSIRELFYHALLLDEMQLGTDAKIQIHIGGVYGDKKESMDRFAKEYDRLDSAIRRRLVIENDDSRYHLANCLELHSMTGIPILYDEFHNLVNPSGYSTSEALSAVSATWQCSDGIPMVDFSVQAEGEKRGTHAPSIDMTEFVAFLERSKPFDFDIMLEIKDKELSGLKAVDAAQDDERYRAILVKN